MVNYYDKKHTCSDRILYIYLNILRETTKKSTDFNYDINLFSYRNWQLLLVKKTLIDGRKVHLEDGDFLLQYFNEPFIKKKLYMNLFYKTRRRIQRPLFNHN